MDPQQTQQFFMQVDRNKSGSICDTELQMALQNGTGSMFNIKTIQLMMGMFDFDGNGTLNFQEFHQLFNYVQQWIGCFRRYDQDRSNTISTMELQNALTSFGFRLSNQFVQRMVQKFDRSRVGAVAFDDFIHACVSLQTLTFAFMRYDTQRMGVANMRYEDFLTAAFSVIP